MNSKNNYNDIALEAIKNVVPTANPAEFASMNQTIYKVAMEAARLQSERFYKDLEQNYIDSLIEESLC